MNDFTGDKMATVQHLSNYNHLQGEEDISFVDMDKIRHSRDNHIARAFETNL
jgi:hypothetical protein